MRRFVRLCEELEARPDDGDRVAALARWFADAGREPALAAVDWLLPAERGRRAARPPRIPLHRLHAAAREVAAQCGIDGWLFDAGARACGDPAEAIALNLPDVAVGDPASTSRDPTLAQWLHAWRTAAAVETVDDRACAVARAIAALRDRPARRWAVRAVCALSRPVVTPWQWMRAWAIAFGEDVAMLAWTWHTHGRMQAIHGERDLLAPVPRPEPFARHVRLDPVAARAAAAMPTDAQEPSERWPEPHWRGPRVQVVRAGDAIALWHEQGELLNARLDSLLHAVAWPQSSVIEGVLIGWRARRVVSPWATQAPLRPRQARGRASDPATEPPSLHLVLTDWHRWEGDDAAGRPLGARRARLCERWPEFDVRAHGDVPPPVFVTPSGVDVEADAVVLRRVAGGLLLRPAGAREVAMPGAVWHLPAPRHRVRVVLQYVPSEALGDSGQAALAWLPCGFALWSRMPRSARERAAGMAHSLSPLTEPDPEAQSTGHGAEPPARLLPLVRSPLALPADRLARLHAWVRQHAGPRFGAMNTVLPALVFELSFDTAHESRRHRAGVMLEDVRVEDWMELAPAGEADDLAALQAALRPA